MTIPTTAHQVKIAVDSDKPGVASTTNHFGDLLVHHHTFRRIQTLLFVVAQLAVDAVTPCVRVSP